MITIEVGGAEGFKRSLGILEDAIQNMDIILAKNAEPFLLHHMEKQFETSGAYGGSPWAQYGSEPKYGAWKARVAGHSRPLEMREGFMRLKPSLTNKNHPESIITADTKGFTFGTKVPYAVKLSQGGIGPFGEPFPARKIFAFQPSHINALVRSIQHDVMKSVKANQRSGVRHNL